MIVESENYPIKQNYEITKAYVKDMNTEGRGVTLMIGEDETKKEDNINKQFQYLGLLKLEETQQRDETTTFLIGTTVRTWTSVKVTLTATGSQYLIQEKAGTFVVNLWETDINEVTGIQEMPEQKLAQADYNLSNKNITPFGSLFTDKNNTSNRSVHFSLYDDGWRIQ
jgi:hypothetical protein